MNFVMQFGGEAFKVENPKAGRVDSMISGHFKFCLSYDVSYLNFSLVQCKIQPMLQRAQKETGWIQVLLLSCVIC